MFAANHALAYMCCNTAGGATQQVMVLLPTGARGHQFGNSLTIHHTSILLTLNTKLRTQ